MAIQTTSSWAVGHSLWRFKLLPHEQYSLYMRIHTASSWILYTWGFTLLPREFSIHDDSNCFHMNSIYSLYIGLPEWHEGGHLKGATRRPDRRDWGRKGAGGERRAATCKQPSRILYYIISFKVFVKYQCLILQFLFENRTNLNGTFWKSWYQDKLKEFVSIYNWNRLNYSELYLVDWEKSYSPAHLRKIIKTWLTLGSKPSCHTSMTT